MKVTWFSFYNLVLALWIGGIAIVTFIITPVIFKAYGRNMAGEIVGHLFPGYFLYNLILAAAALILFFLLGTERTTFANRLSLILLAAALIVNVFIVFKLHPEAVKAKHEVASFERAAPDSSARKKFSRLHGLSASLNLLLLADGIALLLVSPLPKK
jgi:Ca2+/Na+ antiporter